MNKQEAQALRTRNKLVDAFWELMSEIGFKEITVKNITDRAGVYRSTFYLHFVDMYELLEQQEDALIDEWKLHWSQEAKASSAAGDFKQVVTILSGFYTTHGDKIFLLLGEHGIGNFEQKIKKTMYEQSKELMQVQGSIEFDYLFEFFANAIIYTMAKWYQDRDVVPIESVISMMYEIVETGFKYVA